MVTSDAILIFDGILDDLALPLTESQIFDLAIMLPLRLKLNALGADRGHNDVLQQAALLEYLLAWWRSIQSYNLFFHCGLLFGG